MNQNQMYVHIQTYIDTKLKRVYTRIVIVCGKTIVCMYLQMYNVCSDDYISRIHSEKFVFKHDLSSCLIFCSDECIRG